MFALRDAPASAALSYGWGAGAGSSRTTMLHFEELRASLPVSVELSDALFQMSYTSCEWIWLDAICINQANTREKNHQVKKMNSIYERASAVLVWLGKEIQDLHSLSQASKTSPTGSIDYANLSRSVHLEQALVERAFASPVIKEWFNAGDLVWWARLCIIQEIVSSARVTVCIGALMLSWEDFAQTIRRLPDYFRPEGKSNMVQQLR